MTLSEDPRQNISLNNGRVGGKDESYSVSNPYMNIKEWQ